jgi:hypothetical protein
MRTSPFTPKAESDKTVHFLVKKSKQAANNVHNTITGIFPNSGDVPHSIRLYSAVFYLAVVCAAFVYLFMTGYRSTLKTLSFCNHMWEIACLPPMKIAL